MSPEERFKALEEVHPTPWQIVCQYVAGVYSPTKILDANGDLVLEALWGSGTPEGMHTYACIVEAVQDRIEYGNPW